VPYVGPIPLRPQLNHPKGGCITPLGRLKSWATYGSFLMVAVVLVLVPGPDFAVVTNTLAAMDYRVDGTVSAATT
jgi:hypothetical protein